MGWPDTVVKFFGRTGERSPSISSDSFAGLSSLIRKPRAALAHARRQNHHKRFSVLPAISRPPDSLYNSPPPLSSRRKSAEGGRPRDLLLVSRPKLVCLRFAPCLCDLCVNPHRVRAR